MGRGASSLSGKKGSIVPKKKEGGGLSSLQLRKRLNNTAPQKEGPYAAEKNAARRDGREPASRLCRSSEGVVERCNKLEQHKMGSQGKDASETKAGR